MSEFVFMMDPGTLYLLANLHQLKNGHVNFDEIIKRNLLNQHVNHSRGGIRSVLVPVPKSCDLKFKSPKRRCSETKQGHMNQYQKVGKAAPGQYDSKAQSVGQKTVNHTGVHINPLPKENKFGVSNLNAAAKDKFNVDIEDISVQYSTENIEAKEENAGSQHFLLLSQCFPKSTLSETSVFEKVKWHGYSSPEDSVKFQDRKMPSRQASSTQSIYSEQRRNVEHIMKDEARPQELYTSHLTQGRPFHDSPHDIRYPVDVNPNMQQSLKQIDPHQNYKIMAQNERYKTAMAGSGRESDFKSNCSKHFVPEYTGDNNEIINLSKNRNTAVSVPETQGFVTEMRQNQSGQQNFFDKYRSLTSSNYKSNSSSGYRSHTSTIDQSQTSKHSVDNLYPTAFQQRPHNCSLKQAAVTGFSMKSDDLPHVPIPQHERPATQSNMVISRTSGSHTNIHNSAALDDRTLKDRLNAPTYNKYTHGSSGNSGNVKMIPHTIKDKPNFKDDFTHGLLKNGDNQELFSEKLSDLKDGFTQPFLKNDDNRELFSKKSSDFKDGFTQPFMKNDDNREFFTDKSSDVSYERNKYMEETPLRSDNTCIRVPDFTTNSGCEIVVKQEVEEGSSSYNQVMMSVAKNRKLLTDISEMEDIIAILMKAQTSFHKPPYTKVKEELMEKHRINIESHLREPKSGPERDLLVNKWLSEFVEASVVTMIKFAKGIPGFKELNLQDQAQLLKGSKSESLMSGGMVIIDYEHELLTVQDGHHFMFEDLIKVFSQKYFVKKLESLIMVEALRFSERETAIVRAMTIVNPDRCALEERSKVEVIYNQLLDCLQYEIGAHYLHVDARLRQILDLLQDMKEISELQMPSLQSALESKGVLAARPLLAEYMSS